LLQGYFTYNRHLYQVRRYLLTNASGVWSTSISLKNIGSRTQWYVAYPGEEAINSALSAWHTVYVRPKLGIKANVKWTHRHYAVRHGTAFKLGGTESPAMKGNRLTLQYRLYGSRRWHATTIKATITSSGTYVVKLVFSRSVKEYLRWSFKGATSGNWLSATSPGKLFVVS
jgi:hypothetical protein